MIKTHAFYFGCLRQPGHFLWRGPEDDHGYMESAREHGLPFDPGRMDGGLAPRNTRGGEVAEGLASHGILNGWTIISFWDRSVDSRPGSSSTFFIQGQMGFVGALSQARAAFPRIFQRFSFQIKPYQ